MNKKEIEFRDPVVERVVDKFISRSDIGYKKYGVTLEKDKSNMNEWLNHLQEELMDAVLYLQKAKEVYTEDLQQSILEYNLQYSKVMNMQVKDEKII
tara:strand:+ start:621 stop:911 length:291 start_codon:yes stop_codon:yes gene_type:complete